MKSSEATPRARARAFYIYALTALILAVFFIAWESIVVAMQVPRYLIPTFSSVMADLIARFPSLAYHVQITLIETGAGFALGTIVGYSIALLLSLSRVLVTSVYPLVIAFRAVPAIAFAPLLVVWFGFTLYPIVFTAAIISFFPVLVNSLAGFNSIDQTTLELLRSMGASKLQILKYARIRASTLYLFPALKIAITLAVIGAVVGEWLGTNKGLGFMLLVANNTLDTLLLFDLIILLGVIGVGLFGSATLAEHFALRWREPTA